MLAKNRDDVPLFDPLLADGRHFLSLGALGLFFSGVFAVFLAATRQLLPQDSDYLQMTASELCAQGACRILHFMVHDRLSFGGGLISISILYLWLVHFPLRDGQAWAWWTILVSVTMGIASFFSFLGFGYLDTWHAVATIVLTVLFAAGLAMTHGRLRDNRGIASLFHGSLRVQIRNTAGKARLLIFGTAVGMVVGGLVICIVGMTVVFVPQDLEFMKLTPATLHAMNPRLIPLIAHDRAGFGGAVFNIGLVLFFCIWHAKPTRAFRQALSLAGAVGFTSAIGIHLAVGYVNLTHMAPACLGAIAFATGMMLMGRVEVCKYQDDS